MPLGSNVGAETVVQEGPKIGSDIAIPQAVEGAEDAKRTRGDKPRQSKAAG